MRLVTFALAQAPHGVGDTRLVPDALAKQLKGDGVIADLGELWPPALAAAAPQKPAPRQVKPPARPVVAPAKRVAR